MMTPFGVRKLLFAAPLLAVAAAWALPSTDTVVAAAALPDVTADVAQDVTADVVTDEASEVEVTEVSTDEAFFAVNNCTYYNNAAHSVVVGQFGYDCCNNPVSWGKKSKFSACGGCFPCIPPPQ